MGLNQNNAYKKSGHSPLERLGNLSRLGIELNGNERDTSIFKSSSSTWEITGIGVSFGLNAFCPVSVNSLCSYPPNSCVFNTAIHRILLQKHNE